MHTNRNKTQEASRTHNYKVNVCAFKAPHHQASYARNTTTSNTVAKHQRVLVITSKTPILDTMHHDNKAAKT